MKRKGFTLIELMVVLTFMGIISVFIYQQFRLQQGALREQQEFSRSNIKTRRACEYIVSELRHIGFSRRPLSPDSYFGIIAGKSNSILYSHDILGENEGSLDAEDMHSIEKIADTLFIDGDRAANFLDSLGFTYIDIMGDTVDPTETVEEVDEYGEWQMDTVYHGSDPGHYPINIIDYTIRFITPDGDRKITYHEAVQIRNVRGPALKEE
jgi:prepilin-type N-terminal cleavage/methylation domain-containing protein